MIYLYGDDTYGVREEISNIVKKEEATIRWLEKEDFVQKTIIDWLGESNGLFGKELMVIRDPSGLPAKIQEDILKVSDDQLCVLWDRVTPDKRSKLFKRFKAKAVEFPYLPDQKLSAWIIDLVKSMSGKIESQTALSLISLLGKDRWRLKSELERMVLINPEVTAQVIEREISVSAQAEIFSTLEAITSGNVEQSVRSVERLLEQGDSRFYMLSMLAYQFKTLAKVRDGLDRGQSQHDIVRENKLHPYVVQKSAVVVKNISKQKIVNNLMKIVATDFAIKQGKVDAQTGLMMLVVGLAG